VDIPFCAGANSAATGSRCAPRMKAGCCCWRCPP